MKAKAWRRRRCRRGEQNIEKDADRPISRNNPGRMIRQAGEVLQIMYDRGRGGFG